jgi:hypothetical protein
MACLAVSVAAWAMAGCGSDGGLDQDAAEVEALAHDSGLPLCRWIADQLYGTHAFVMPLTQLPGSVALEKDGMVICFEQQSVEATLGIISDGTPLPAASPSGTQRPMMR